MTDKNLDTVINEYISKGHDFGWSGVNELPYEETIQSQQENVETLTKRLKTAEELIMPLLVSLLQVKENYIHWPTAKRQTQVKDVIDKLIKTTRITT